MSSHRANFTRGNGILENFLAKKRAKLANKKIPEELREGSVLDIGCGKFPFFLNNTKFKIKYGLDQFDLHSDDKDVSHRDDGINLIKHDIESGEKIPFPDEHFDVITMLAVIEHLDPKKLVEVMSDIYRILKPGGAYIVTTPAAWTHGLLLAVSRTGLISREEIDDHEHQYTRKALRSALKKSNFSEEKTSSGYFELFANIWAVARK